MSGARLRGVGIGAGYFSQFHYEAWSRLDDAALSAVCDLDQAKASEVAERHSIGNTYTDAAQMMDAESPDFVDIITRPGTHLELVRLAAERGIDVICQKPLAPAFAESQLIVQVAQDAGIRLMVHENFRFQPWHREMRRLLDEGAVGRNVHSIRCITRTGDGWAGDAYLSRQPYFRTMPQLLVFETGVHFIDTYRYLAGEIDGVYAMLRRLNENIAGEDDGVIVFEFADGARGLWDASRYHEPTEGDPRYTFGQFLIETDGGAIRLYLDGSLTTQKLGEPEQVHDYAHGPRGFASDCVFNTQQHFVASLLSGDAFETSGEEYLKTLRVQEAVYESAALRQPVRGLGGNQHANR